MYKVLQITGTLHRGGLETFAMNVYRAIDRKRIQFDFLIHKETGPYVEEVESLGGRVYYIPPRNKGFLPFYKHLDAFFRSHACEYCAVHMHVSTLSSIEALYFARKYGIKVRIIHSHSSSVSGNKLHYLLHYLMKPFVHSWATHYLGCSNKAITWLYKGTGVLHQTKMIKNGIDINRFTYNESVRQEVRHNLHVDKCFIVGHVGRFIWIKNHKFILDIFHELRIKVPNAKLVLVGDGILFTEIKQLVDNMGMTKDVLFLGLRSDIDQLLQGFDAFLMPSFYEGLPVSLVEAQCAGLPVFGSDTISQDTQITPNMHFISLDESAEIWAKHISDCCNEYMRNNMGNAIRKAGFDIQQTTVELTKIYLSSNAQV